MQADKDLLQTYYWDPMPEEEEIARSRRFESRLKELGYEWYALIFELQSHHRLIHLRIRSPSSQVEMKSPHQWSLYMAI